MDRGWPGIASLCALAAALFLGAALLAAQFLYGGIPSLANVLADSSLLSAVRLSLFTSLTAACLALLVGLPAAWALARRDFPGRLLVDLLIDVPLVLSPVAVGVCLLLLFRTAPGRWVEGNLLAFVFEVPGIVLAQFAVSLALSVRVMKAAFEEVDERYEQVARFLGLTPGETFLRVTLPLARRGIFAAFLLSFARSLGEYGATVTIAGAVAGKTETMPVAISTRLAFADVGGAVGLIFILTLLGLATLLAVKWLGGRR